MIQTEPTQTVIPNVKRNVCDLSNLLELMDGKKTLMRGVMDAFLKQLPQELKSMSEAIERKDITTIKSLAHTMKSTVSVMGVTLVKPVLHGLEELESGADIQRAKELNQQLNFICNQAMEEKRKYVSQENSFYCGGQRGLCKNIAGLYRKQFSENKGNEDI